MKKYNNRSKKEMDEKERATSAQKYFLHVLVPTEVDRERKYVIERKKA